MSFLKVAVTVYQKANNFYHCGVLLINLSQATLAGLPAKKHATTLKKPSSCRIALLRCNSKITPQFVAVICPFSMLSPRRCPGLLLA